MGSRFRARLGDRARRARAWTLAAGAALVALGGGARGAAAAEPTTSALSFVRLPGAEGCIAAAELGARVEQRLGRKVLVPASDAALSLEGRVERLPGPRYRAVVSGSRRDGTPIGTRELVSRGADCRALDEDLVLVLALLVDPDAALAPPPVAPPAPAPAPTPGTTTVVHERVVVREIVHDAPAAAPSSPWRLEAEAALLVAAARAPGVTPGLALALRAGPTRALTFELGAGLLPAARLDVADVPGRGVDATLAEARLGWCPSVPLASERVEVGGCVGVRLGALRVAGDFPGGETNERGLFDVAAGARATVTLAGPLFASASVAAVVPVVRQILRASAAGRTLDLWERPPLGAEAALGLGLRFSP